MSSKIFYEVITKDNLLHMAQSISVAALKKASCKNQRYQNMYRRLLDDIHTPSIDRPLSDGYELVQSVCCVLLQHLGKKLDDIVGVNKYKRPASVLKLCYAAVNEITYRYTRDAYLEDFIEDEAAISKSVETDITDTEKEYEKVDRIIERLNLSEAEKDTLLLCMHGYGAFAIAKTLSVTHGTVWARRQRIMKKYTAVMV